MADTVLKRFVVVSGLPCSGKSTLARRLAPVLGLPLFDKDAFLEQLFESKGTGDRKWRRALSREADSMLQAHAAASVGAILASFWRLQGMVEDTGTPTAWITDLSSQLVQVHCACSPELAAERFFQRQRHPGHLDGSLSRVEILKSLREVASLGLLELGNRIDVDTSRPVELQSVLGEIRLAFERCRSNA